MQDISGRDHAYTVGLAETALERIKSFRLPGDPASFEIWYTYSGRLIPALNDAINAALADEGTISAHEVDGIYDRYLGTFRLGEQVEQIGESVSSEVDQVLGIIDATIGSAMRHDCSRSEFDWELQRPVDLPAVIFIVEALVEATRAGAHENHGYKIRLEAARGEISRLHDSLAAIRFESRTGGLTALSNRKQFDQSLGKEIRRAIETAGPLSLRMCDVDHFKAFNDAWGHPLGDDILRLIARTIREVVRDADVAARCGGEEFAVILPDTDLKTAVGIAERLRRSGCEKQIVQSSTGASLGLITVSIGVAEWERGWPERDLVEHADTCLFAAKRQGRNRVVWGRSEEMAGLERSDAASRVRVTTTIRERDR